MCHVLKDVAGYDGRCNDVLYCPPAEKHESIGATIYFGGDLQDFAENMTKEKLGNLWVAADENNRQCVQWNLDRTATIMQNSFPRSHIIIVRPSKIECRAFSCYVNFVPCSTFGIPDHTPTHYGLNHLKLLLESIGVRMGLCIGHQNPNAQGRSDAFFYDQDCEECKKRQVRFDTCNLTLVGFSKGCVVLNQFLYEFHYLKTLTPGDENLTDFVDRVKDMFWLDGGHPGRKNTWITAIPLLDTLSRLDTKIHVHVTPYQIRDARRPWIGTEQKLFTKRLRDAGADVKESVHFAYDPPCLLRHFQVLTVFSSS